MDNKVSKMRTEAVVTDQDLFQKLSAESEERHVDLSHDRRCLDRDWGRLQFE
jgi:hypothetical protein